MLKLGEKGAILQRDNQTYAIAPHIPCGVVTPQLLRKLADVAEKYGTKALNASSDPFRPLIPIQSGHPFRWNSATYSDPFRPVIPMESGHP
jgi:hypothetical protein